MFWEECGSSLILLFYSVPVVMGIKVSRREELKGTLSEAGP